MRRFFSRPLWIVLAAGSVLGLAVFYGWYRFNLQPAAAQADSIGVHVVSGMAPRQIAAELEEKQVIRSRTAFLVYVRLHGLRTSLKAGWYELDPAKTGAAIAEIIAGGESDMLKLTVPEGYTVRQIAAALHKLPVAEFEDAKLFDAGRYKGVLLNSRPASAGNNLEGYLFPDTYFASPATDLQELVQQMVTNMENQFDKELRKATNRQGITYHEALTLASIVEREVSREEDRPKVAQVLLLRLRQGLLLQADATVLYGAGLTTAGSADIARLIKESDSPYNTYRFRGLPPGPIGNPGLSAIRAVAEPADTDFLYYLSDSNGNTYFARTFEEHQANINRYLR